MGHPGPYKRKKKKKKKKKNYLKHDVTSLKHDVYNYVDVRVNKATVSHV